MLAIFEAGACGTKSFVSVSPALDLSDRLTRVVHLYLAVCETSSGDQDLHKRQLTVQLSQQWAPECEREEIEAVVDTAFLAARSGFSGTVEAVAKALCDELPSEMCTRLLTDLGLIACADGHLTYEEARIIGLVRSAFQNSALGSRRPAPYEA